MIAVPTGDILNSLKIRTPSSAWIHLSVYFVNMANLHMSGKFL